MGKNCRVTIQIYSNFYSISTKWDPKPQVRTPGAVPVTGSGRPGGPTGDRTGPVFFEGDPTGHRTGPVFFGGGPTGHHVLGCHPFTMPLHIRESRHMTMHRQNHLAGLLHVSVQLHLHVLS